jgi:hypothetical protein
MEQENSYAFLMDAKSLRAEPVQRSMKGGAVENLAFF